MSDELTLVLDGKVPLGEYAKAMTGLSELLSALTKEVTPGEVVEWELTSLQVSSVITTARGIGRADAVSNLVQAYERVGTALQTGGPFPYSAAVRKPADRIVGLINGHIESVRFETENTEAMIRHTVAEGAVADAPVAQDGYGGVNGVVETLSRRGRLRFTLYDTVHQKAVSCYLMPGFEDIMRDAWGRRVTVIGRVHRDTVSGRPLSVRHVTEVNQTHEGARGQWREARGVAPATNEISSDKAVRRGRAVSCA